MELKPGYQAIALPAGNRNHWGGLELQSEEDTIAELNEFLAEISTQGGEIVSSFDRKVVLPERGGAVGRPTEPRTFLIVKK